MSEDIGPAEYRLTRVSCRTVDRMVRRGELPDVLGYPTLWWRRRDGSEFYWPYGFEQNVEIVRRGSERAFAVRRFKEDLTPSKVKELM